MRIIRGPEIAKATLLQRVPLEVAEVSPVVRQRIKEVFGEELSPDEAVARIIQDVQIKGDSALFHYSRTIEGVKLTQLEVSKEEVAEAYKAVAPELVQALALAVERVRDFHLRQKQNSWFDFETGLGILLRPLERVGLYVPGGTACYPSTVLMTAIPARVAGVGEVILSTPPRRDGSIPPPTLVAADMAKVDRIFKLGGAQAIAALALGTESVPKVDKICGPGNIFVTLAKKKVYGMVDIDGLHGPTETLLVADDSAEAKFLAADLLAQAEHDEAAAAILITTSSELAEEVAETIERQLARLERRDIARESLRQKGGIIVVQDMQQAIGLVNHYAPEHLCLIVRNPWSYLGQIHHAGGIFVGMDSPEVLGDYIAGPSHVMPTGGTARFFSVLGLADFLKVTSLIALDSEALKALGPAAAAIARAEGLTAHARAVEMRLKLAEGKKD
jgi:histidinol dehydrogenase